MMQLSMDHARWVRCATMLMLSLMWQRAYAAPPITALAVVPDSNAYVIGSQAGIVLHQLSSGNELRRLDTELVQVHDLKFSPDGTQLLAVGGTAAELGRIERWAWPDAGLHRAVNIGNDLIYRACWSNDGQAFAIAASDGTCHVFTEGGSASKTYRGHSRAVLGISFWANDQQVLSASVDQTIQVWSSQLLQRERGLDNHTDGINDLAIQPRRSVESETVPTFVASVSDDYTVRLWQPSIGRMVRFARLESKPRCVRWLPHPSGEDQLVVACDNGQLLFLRTSDLTIAGKLTCDIRPIFELAVVPPHRQLLVAGEGGLRAISY